MSVISTECKDIALYLTEYQRGQLPRQEHLEVEDHLLNCTRCQKENEGLLNLSAELDKIIPSVSKTYERDFVYNLFIRTKKENIFVKFLSIALILSLLVYVFSYNFSASRDFASIKDLKVRSENMFNEDFYSGKKPLNEN
jgi:hypothetical protein